MVWVLNTELYSPRPRPASIEDEDEKGIEDEDEDEDEKGIEDEGLVVLHWGL